VKPGSRVVRWAGPASGGYAAQAPEKGAGENCVLLAPGYTRTVPDPNARCSSRGKETAEETHSHRRSLPQKLGIARWVSGSIRSGREAKAVWSENDQVGSGRSKNVGYGCATRAQVTTWVGTRKLVGPKTQIPMLHGQRRGMTKQVLPFRARAGETVRGPWGRHQERLFGRSLPVPRI